MNEESKNKDIAIEELKSKLDLEPNDFQKLYKIMTNSDLKFNSDTKIELDYNQKVDQNAIKIL